MDKKEKLLAEMEDFLHFHTSELDEEEKSWALEKGYRKCSQCAFSVIDPKTSS